MTDDNVKLAPEYDWTISAQKGLLAAFRTLGGIAAFAVVQYLASDEGIASLVKAWPALVTIAPGIAGIAAYLLNAMKHREN